MHIFSLTETLTESGGNINTPENLRELLTESEKNFSDRPAFVLKDEEGAEYNVTYDANGGVIYDNIIPEMLSKLPDVLIGIVIVLVLSASMSTLSSLVLTSSSTVTLDIIKGNIVKKMSDKTQLIVLRVFILFFVALSVIIAWNKTTFIAHTSIIFKSCIK